MKIELTTEQLAQVCEAQHKIAKMPAVSRNEAMAAAGEICNRAERGDDEALRKLCEIAGCASTSEQPAELRKFIVWQLREGPILK